MQKEIEHKIQSGERISTSECLWLYKEAPLEWLQLTADKIRQSKHSEKAFFNISCWPARSIPCLNFPAEPITPVSLTWGITSFFLKIENII